MTQITQIAEKCSTGVSPVIDPHRGPAAIKEKGARASIARGMRSLFQQARPCEAIVGKGHRWETAPCATTGGTPMPPSVLRYIAPWNPVFLFHRGQISAIGRIAASAAFALSCVSATAFAQTTIFSDNFATSQGSTFTTSGTIGTSDWSVFRSGADWGARIDGGIMELTNDASASANVNGWVYSQRTLSSVDGFNTSLSSSTGNVTWTLNMRQIRTDPAGFSSGSYGVAYVLGSNSTSINGTGSGYALVLGGGGSTSTVDPLRFVSFTNGLQGTLTNIITATSPSPLSDVGADYMSLSITYNPTSNLWSLFGSMNSTGFTDPTSGLSSLGTATNTAFTSISLTSTGGYWQGSTTANQTAFFDNISLTLTPASTPAFTTWTGTGSPGTWSNGTNGDFGGAYANDLANTVTFAGTGSTVTASGPPQAGNLVFNSDGYTLAGAVQLGVGNITTTGSITTTLSANITGNGSSGLAKLGAGTLILSGSNSYTGSTSITAGTLEARHANALGTTAAGTTVSDGATLALSNSIAIGAEAITLSGNGSGSNGALRNLSGTNSISGAVTLAANSRIQSDVGTLTLTGGITGTGRALTIAGAGATTLSSSGLNTSTAGSLIKTDAGTLTIDASSSYTGGTSVSGGTITASHNSALGTGVVTITSGTVQASNGISLGNDFTIGTPGAGGSVTTLQSWDFFGQSSPATSTANVTASGLNTTAEFNLLTRGANATSNGAGNSFRTAGFQNNGISTANTDFFQWQIASTGANALGLSTLDARFSGTSTFLPVSAQFAYSTDNTTFTLIGSPFSMLANGSMPQIDLSGITALQGLGSGTTITLRYYASGNTTTGGWGFNSPSAGQNGLELRGTVGTPGPGTGSATLGLNTAGSATYSGNLTIHGAATLTAASSATATFSGNFSGSGNVTKTGAGTVLLTGQANHSGGTTVSEGTLRVNGFHASAVTVSTGATLGGNGTISGLATLNSGANLSPGNSVGNLNFNGGLTLQAGSSVTMEINGTAPGQFDTITVASAPLTYGGTLSLVFAGGYTPAVNSTYTLFTGASVASATGNFTSLSFNNAEYQGTFNPTSGVLTLTVVPEPQTWALLALGALILLGMNRKKFTLRFPNHAASPPSMI